MTFSPFKVYTQFRRPVQPCTPVAERKYTLTHSDTTGDLFLTVAFEIAEDQLNELRDEVIGEWRTDHCNLNFYGKVFVGDERWPEAWQKLRYQIFVKELPTALKAIFYGERWLIEQEPCLLEVPVYVEFQSNFSSFNGVMYMGLVSDYYVAE
ncbi:staygreen family protein [Thalassobacillus hwangdonensis]|uniref:Staygreen family protein n=1 Tax=Thalassobacillus hwangdonensis TaxID=546108 RepID=A0ABW3KXX1_9BACI